MANVLIGDVNTVTRRRIWPQAAKILTPLSNFIGKVLPSTTGVKDTGGESYQHRFKMKYARAVGGGMRGAEQTLPVGRKAKYDEMILNMIRFYVTWNYDGPLGDVPDEMQIIKYLADGLEDCRWTLQHMQEMAFLGNGTPAIAVVDGATSEAGGRTYVDLLEDEVWAGSRRLVDADIIDIYTPNVAGVFVGEGTDSEAVSALEVRIETDGQISLLGTSLGISDADGIFWDNSHGTYIDDNPNGLALLVDGPNSHAASWEVGATCQSLDGTSKTHWQSYVNSAAAARWLTDTLIFQLVRGLERKNRGEKISSKSHILMSSEELADRWVIDHEGERQWHNTNEIIGGVPTVPVYIGTRKVNWVPVRGCGQGVLYCLGTKDLLHKQVAGGIRPMDDQVFKRVENYDINRTQMKNYGQFGIRRRTACAKMLDLRES